MKKEVENWLEQAEHDIEVAEYNLKECKGGTGMGEEESKLVKALKVFKEKICQKYNIKEMILFGSQVSGEADENSDVDLIVVGDEFKNKSPLKRPVALYLEWTMDYPVDFLCYTPEEFEEKRKEISIVRHAIKEGVVI